MKKSNEYFTMFIIGNGTFSKRFLTPRIHTPMLAITLYIIFDLYFVFFQTLLDGTIPFSQHEC